MRLRVGGVLVMLVLLIQAGCASRWYKAGATQQDFVTESYECERDARQSHYFGGGIVGAVNFQGFYERCLAARGWTKIQEEASQPLSMASSGRPGGPPSPPPAPPGFLATRQPPPQPPASPALPRPSAQAVVSVPAPEPVLIPVPGFTIRGTGWGEAWSLSLPAFRLDSVPVTNRVFLTFVLAHPQWLKSQVPATAHDGGYLRHWSGDTGLASGELDMPVVHVSFAAARAFCQSRGLKVPRFNHYRAAAPLPAIEEVALTYEAPYTAPQWAFVQTEWTDGTWVEEATQGMRIVYRHGTKHRGGRRSRDYTPMVDIRTTSPALGFRCAGPGGDAGPAGSS